MTAGQQSTISEHGNTASAMIDPTYLFRFNFDDSADTFSPASDADSSIVICFAIDAVFPFLLRSAWPPGFREIKLWGVTILPPKMTWIGPPFVGAVPPLPTMAAALFLFEPVNEIAWSFTRS